MTRVFSALVALVSVLASALASAHASLETLGNVTALAVAPEGLFIGTFDQGLYLRQIDGSLVRVREPALNPNINALSYDAPNRQLWLATARGVVLCATSPVRDCRRVGSAVEVHALLLRRDGSVLAGGEAGLAFINRAGAVELIFDRKHGAPFRGVWALAEASDGTLFVGSSNGLHWGAFDRFRNAAEGSPDALPFGRAALVSGQLADDWVTAIAISSGRVIVGTYNAGVAILARAGHELEPLAADAGLGYVNVAGIQVLAGERLAVCTMDGLRVGAPGSWQTVPTRSSDVTAVVPAEPGSPAISRYFVGTRGGVVEQRL